MQYNTNHLAKGKFYILYKDQLALGGNRVCVHYKRQRTNRFMLFRVTIDFYCQMHKKHENTLCYQNPQFLNVTESNDLKDTSSVKYYLPETLRYQSV